MGFANLTYPVECSYGFGKNPPAELPAAAVWMLKGLNVGSTTNAPFDPAEEMAWLFLTASIGLFKVVGNSWFCNVCGSFGKWSFENADESCGLNRFDLTLLIISPPRGG